MLSFRVVVTRSSWIAPLLAACSLMTALPASAAAPSTGQWGAGVILGEPTGFTGAYVLDQDHVIDGGLADSFIGQSDWQIYSDYLWRNNHLYQDQAPEVDFYYGVGLRLKFESSARFGVRVPGGATYQIANSPIQLFGELAPIVDVAPDISMRVNIAIGAR